MENKLETLADYNERVNEVLSYINNNLDENLDLKTLSEVSNFSTFHFHRIMRSFLNEPIGSYIVRIRLEAAANFIVHTDLSITDIAYKIGYDTPSSFTRAFKKRFDVSPADFKENKNIKLNYMKPQEINESYDLPGFKLKPKIKDHKKKKAVYVQSIGDYSGTGTGESWEKIFSFVKRNKLFHWKTEGFGISLDNPEITESENCRYLACVTVTKEVKPEGEVGVMDIEGGKFAIFRYKGPYTNLNIVYSAIFKKWMPESGYILRDQPMMEKYINNPKKTNPEKYITDIYVPVK